MVFTGSEKYPGKNEFKQFIRRAGGDCNAGMDLDDTSFNFDVHVVFLNEAFDRFSQFFIAPLMQKETMLRD